MERADVKIAEVAAVGKSVIPKGSSPGKLKQVFMTLTNKARHVGHKTLNIG